MSTKLLIWCLLLLLLWTKPSAAMEIYAYRRGEYAIVYGGRSPDHRWSIAGHDREPYGDNFDLYLMREPAHEKPVPLQLQEGMDTGPLSVAALWAPDSGHVAILNRTDRHVLGLWVFSVADGKARSIDVPSLVSVVGGRHLKAGAPHELASRIYRVTWQTPKRLAFDEFDFFDAADPIFNGGLEAYLTVDRRGPLRTFTSFAANAVCEITESGDLKLLSVKPLSKWPGTIVYSPNLRYDRKGGLHGIISFPPGW